jgi:hypothetical protein
MKMLEHALALAAQGFHVFPLLPEGVKFIDHKGVERTSDGKYPAIADFPNKATRDAKQIRAWFSSREYNVAISTTSFEDDKALLVVDVDNKNGKNGDDELLRLELAGDFLPDTYTQFTPTGGRHLVFSVDEPVKQGANTFGPGLDSRGKGGYIVGAGSVRDCGPYTANGSAVAPAPQWAVDVCGRPAARREADAGGEALAADVDPTRAHRRAIDYLTNHAPASVEGQGGDQTAYVVACRVKDFGASRADCFALMLEHWNDRCSPPWSDEDLSEKVDNAYSYGTEPVGISAPEAEFPPVASSDAAADEKGHPFEELNKQYAFVIAGGSGNILWETTGPEGNFEFHLLQKSTFMDRLSNQQIQVGKKTEQLANAWMQWPGRRQYDGLVFEPGREMGSRWYNMWRGFVTTPIDGEPDHYALDMWLDHARDNVCGGNEELFTWLMTWFAHLVQRPFEKPLVAVAFKGKKGTGKNALIERVGKLVGSHFLLTSRRRYITSNFTGHLQYCLLFVMDEAFWSGDKEAEGVVKDLITGDKHDIEMKGREPYKVRNLTRVGVIGNEDWLVPASADERRWAVFSIGEGRMQDRSYFEKMRIGIDHQGGNRHLLKFLMDWDLSRADINKAPETTGLLEQKIASLEPFEQWWLDCLTEGHIAASDFGQEWPEAIECERLRAAFGRYLKDRNIRTRAPDSRTVGRTLVKLLGDVKKNRGPKGEGQPWRYVLPDLEEARARWEKFIGHRVEWE